MNTAEQNKVFCCKSLFSLAELKQKGFLLTNLNIFMLKIFYFSNKVEFS